METKDRIDEFKKMMVRFDVEPTELPTPPYGHQGVGRDWDEVVIKEFLVWHDGSEVYPEFHGYIRSDVVKAMIDEAVKDALYDEHYYNAINRSISD